ncbi:MAG: CNP1-like family protein [Rhodoferax sp.]|nr:CNP1-like family protein [Rhodoferax sp.]
MHFRFLSLIALLIAATGAQGQGSTSDAGWQESDVPAPPVVIGKDLIPIDMPANLALRFGVDPKTLTITNDGVVRYVMVASNDQGARNVMYEGVRCATGEVRTYARQDSTGQWTADAQAQWRPLHGQRDGPRHGRVATGGLLGTHGQHGLCGRPYQETQELETGPALIGGLPAEHHVVPMHHLGLCHITQQFFDLA